MVKSKHSRAVCNLVQPFNSNQSCDTTTLKDFLNVLGLRNKLKVIWVFINEAMNEVNLLQCFQERRQIRLGLEAFLRFGATVLSLAVEDGQICDPIPINVCTKEYASY